MAKIAIRRVFGPFSITIEQEQVHGGKPKPPFRLSWFFWGVRSDGSIKRWNLFFDPKTRKFSVGHIPVRPVKHGGGLSDALPCLPELKDAMLSAPLRDHPIMDGQIAPILRRHLRPSDNAECLRATIAWNGGL